MTGNLQSAIERLGFEMVELKKAKDNFDDLEREASVANNNRTAALNKLNEAQKRVDKILAEIKSASGGDWAKKDVRP